MKQDLAPKTLMVMRKVEFWVTEAENERLKLTPKEEKLLDWYLEKYLKIKRNPLKTTWRFGWTEAPCECTDDVICGYCVLANMIEWEKQNTISEGEIAEIKRLGIRNISRRLGVAEATLRRWVKKREIPPTYKEELFVLLRHGHTTLHTP